MREHLLDCGAELFAERGFKNVTVRDISAGAGANVAAVNYYFRDKMGLYREIVEREIAVMEETTRQAMAAGGNARPDAQLRAYVRVFVERLRAPRVENHIQQIMMREMADPTPMLDVIAARVMRPRMDYLCGIIGRLMQRPPADPRVTNSAVSVQAQCLMCKTTPVLARMKMGFSYGAADTARLADFITDFSLAAITSPARAPRARSPRAASASRRAARTQYPPTR